jgi:signal transduction histidine kinase
MLIFERSQSLSGLRRRHHYRASVIPVRLERFVRIYGDWALALGLAVVWQVEVWTMTPPDTPGDVAIPAAYSAAERVAAATIGLILALVLAWRRRLPLTVLALAIAVSVAAHFLAILDAATVPALALVIAAYTVGAHAKGSRAWIGGLGVVALIAVNIWGEFSPSDVLFVGMILGGAWLAGRATCHWREREQTLKRLTVELERQREESARAAVAEERVRIARELHDVVAHSIGVIVLQARGGRRSLASDPDETREALCTIETTGSQSLAEMRRLLGVLRRGDEQAALTPQPSLRHLDTLAAQVREAGLPVELSVEGRPTDLPPGVDLSAYRIVQEALTNALKHAGPATASVVIRYGENDVELEIADTGVGQGASDGGGHGLIGIRERVAIYGGELEAGPRPDGGFRLRARLPVEAA